MKNTLIFAAVVLLAAPLAFAQDGYGDKVAETQTRNIPAGVVNDPGSQLIFLLDTGLDAEANYSGSDNYTDWSVSDFDADNSQSPFQNFISITNVNPTDSVTVHFRFINRACSDVLDFLVVLSCNDTMLIDPFDYDIPGTSLNTKDRFFGTALDPDDPLGGIVASLFADGRFLLFVTAAGDPVDAADDYADNLFPYELRADVGEECDAVDTATIGDSPGGIRDDNLHILNSSAISFNYLTGFYSIAIPTAFLSGQLPPTANDLAYGVRAWARPAIDMDADGNNDGDAVQAPKGVVLAGTEGINVDEDQLGAVLDNEYYLKNEVQAGVYDDDLRTVEGGALGWTLYPGSPDGVIESQQFVHFASLVDDYDGSNNIHTNVVAEDWSYGMDPARTQFQVVVWNNDEEALTLQPPEVPVSPPPDFDPFSLVIRVDCITAYSDAGTLLGTFSVQDLFNVGGPEVEAFLAEPVGAPNEKGPGWLRFDRLNTIPLQTETASGFNSYLVVGQSVVRFEGFGVSWWLPAVATDPSVPDVPQ
jgi:hypothetical protein